MSSPESDRSDSPRDGAADDASISEAEFAEWLRQPGHIDEFVGWLRTIDVDAAPNLSAPARAAIRASIAKWHEQAAIEAVQARVRQLMELLQRRPDPDSPHETLHQCNVLLDEVVDRLLDAPEPHRTKLFQVILPIREELRALARDR